MPEKVAIVTAASAGIGAGCARELAARGFRVSLLARSDAVIDVARDLGGIATKGSVTDPDALQRLVGNTLEKYGRIDATVINTGHPPKAGLLEVTDEQWHEGIDMVLLPVVRLARLLTPVFERQGRGAIVNISSFTAREPGAQRPVSSALRAALSSFTHMYSDRHAAKNIRMNSVLPGWVDTYPVSPSDISQIPMGRIARVQEIARVVAFLLSDEASYVSGQNVVVDGGLLRSV